MCGRFYIDDETAREIERTVRKVDEQLRRERITGDIHPMDKAAVITAEQKELIADAKWWGFPGFGSSKVIFNARAESVLDKKMFRESVLKRRLIVPATGFYEWNARKEKVTFTPMEGLSGEHGRGYGERSEGPGILYLAGFYNRYEGEDRFVILTTAANESMASTHDRMPLILEREELEVWLWEDSKLEQLLRKEPGQLRRKMEYEQQKLEFF